MLAVRRYAPRCLPRSHSYIAQVVASERVEAKIRERHNVTMREVSEAVVLTPVVRSFWHWHPERGWRLLLTGETAGSRLLDVVLYPVDETDGVWELATAMESAKPRRG